MTESGALLGLLLGAGRAATRPPSAVDRMLGGRAAVRRRLDALATELTVEDFRVEQVVPAGSAWPALPEFIDANTATGQFVVERNRYVDG